MCRICMYRLATEMSTKIASDESSLENISIRNRPMNIASDYQNFCSNAWLSAKEKLDKVKGKEVEKLSFLTWILEVGSFGKFDRHNKWECLYCQ